MHWTCGTDAETVDRALAEAEVRVSQSLYNQRLIPTAMEPRGSIGVYDPSTEEYTLWATSQAPHVHRLVVAAFVLGIQEQKIRVISPNIGGGFGQKVVPQREELCTVVAAQHQVVAEVLLGPRSSRKWPSALSMPAHLLAAMRRWSRLSTRSVKRVIGK